MGAIGRWRLYTLFRDAICCTYRYRTARVRSRYPSCLDGAQSTRCCVATALRCPGPVSRERSTVESNQVVNRYISRRSMRSMSRPNSWSDIATIVSAIATFVIAVVTVVGFVFGYQQYIRIEFDFVLQCRSEEAITVDVFQISGRPYPLTSIQTIIQAVDNSGDEHTVDDTYRTPDITTSDPLIYELTIPRSSLCIVDECANRTINHVTLKYEINGNTRRRILWCKDTEE